MRTLLSDFVLVCDDKFDIIQNGGVCFDEKIIEVGGGEELAAKYKNAKIERLPKNSVLMAGLINSHVHLEFSANKATFSYGDFMLWLKSVINFREEIQSGCDEGLIKGVLDDILKSGTTSIGAISSYGLDFKPCLETPLRVVYFVEAIGSNPSAIDALFSDFKSRYYEAREAKSDSFIPAVSVHSPYSTHPVLARHALKIAKNADALVAAHFMESLHERKWLDENGGAMGEFMKNFNPNAKAMVGADEFLKLFEGVKTLFAHAVHANDKELETIAKAKNAIAHCPRSNALLGTGALDLKNALSLGANLTIGTDGLSSNISLNLWDEMRAALFTHQNFEPNSLAVLLIKAATNGAALNLNGGELTHGKDADIIALQLQELPKDLSQLPLQIILQTNNAKRVFVGGEEFGR